MTQHGMTQHGEWTPVDGAAPTWTQDRPAVPSWLQDRPVAPTSTGGWPAPSAVPPYWVANRPSGLFPSGPVRPTYREPYPVRSGMVAAGFSATAMWMLLVGLLGDTIGWYAWLSLIGGLIAASVAVLLARFGDRGAAVGAAVATGLALGVTVTVVAAKWLSGDWPLW